VPPSNFPVQAFLQFLSIARIGAYGHIQEHKTPAYFCLCEGLAQHKAH
jgi:hypothetical protein